MPALLLLIAKIAFSMLAVSAVAVGVANVVAPQPTDAQLTSGKSVPPAGADTQGVQKAQEQLARIPAGGGGDITIRLSDSELTALARTYSTEMSFAGSRLEKIQVRAADDKLTVDAHTTFPFSPAVQMQATPVLREGKLSITIGKFTVAGAGVPDDLRADVQKRIQAAIDSELPTGTTVRSVSAQSGYLTILLNVRR